MFVTYSGARRDGTSFRNTEFFRTRTGRSPRWKSISERRLPPSGHEDELQAVLADVSAAIRAKDAKARVSHYAANVLAFDLINPLQYRGRDEVMGRAEEWFSSWDGAVKFEMEEVVFSVGAETAFCHALHHVAGTQGGQEINMWWRATTGFGKRDTKWVITHMHSSVPFDMATGKASMDQRP